MDGGLAHGGQFIFARTMDGPADSYRIRTMTRAEVAMALEWAAAEGWNPGLHDAECFHAADPGGFLLGVLDGEPIASISVVQYGSSFAFLGLYIVRPAFRGRGYGWRLWQAGMDRLAGRTVGLDGVVAQQANYRRTGFQFAWRNQRLAGVTAGPAPAQREVVRLSEVPLAGLLAYDQPFFPAGRAAFLQCWIDQPAGASLGWRDADGELRGYGVLRRCRTGAKVGPLFADDDAIADALFTSLCAQVPAGTPIFLDVPEPNAAALALGERHGLSLVFETARMYTGTPPALPLERHYGITTFELG
jgi:RimJ/RimL family protein N-acetyltransferase